METGQTIAGKYRLNRLLGTGGMASVWSATNVFTEREFAIKFMLPQVARTPEAARRFLLEAKISARINHPNIIEVIDVGQAEDSSLFLVMELLTGSSLDVAMRRRSPSMLVCDFMVLMRDVAQALAAAHRSGVIHRDLKPTNVFLHTDRDGRTVPKILDFGVSKILEEENNTALTVVGTVLGSPLYMSPEQAMGAEGIDGRTDVFAFGAILFEALSGQRAFDGPNFNALIVKIATTQPKRIDDVAPDVPEPLRAIVRECMVTDKTKRLGSFDRIVEQLDLMMPELETLPLRLKQPPRLEAASEADSLHGSHRSGNLPPSLAHPTSSPGVPAPPSSPTSNSGTAAPNFGPARPSPRALAILAGIIAAGGIVFGVAATFGRADRDSRIPGASAASQGAALAASGGGAHNAAPSTAAPSESSEVPLISVDSLPVATRNAPAKPSGGGVGRLAIVSSPAACAVTIDGVSHGNTPVVGIELSAGAHRIDCAPSSGKPKTANVTIVDGASARYKFAFDE
jgi:eukaryotic-like serine/threonine-protein kinase